WYHFHSTVESFFEPAHALLYTGLFAAYAFTAIELWTMHGRGFRWPKTIPIGYRGTIIGLAICLAGGLGDMLKHSLWGFEEGFNALLSPTHMLIGAGMLLVVTGPIRSALLRKPQPSTWAGQIGLILSAASMMELVHWATQFVFLSEAERFNAPLNPDSIPHSTLTLLTLQYDKEGIGLLAVIVQSIIVAGFFLYFARRIRLVFGGFTLLMVTGNIFIAAADSNYPGQFAAVLLASVVCGSIADGFRLNPSGEFPRRWAVAAFLVPASYWAVMLCVLSVTAGGVWWSSDVISGSILFAGLAGLFLNAFSAAGTSDVWTRSP
ncbi:MAG TPA: hypothetical protein VGM99_00570, partial [Candidatus Cybelea sp.]